MRYVLLLAGIAATLLASLGALDTFSTGGARGSTIGEAAVAADPFGATHISAVNSQLTTFASSRYQQAQQAGAAWNRWVFYWHEIEPVQGATDYTPQEIVVNQDVANGYRYKIDAVLMGTPEWAIGAAASSAGTHPPPRVGPRAFRTVESSANVYSAPSPVTYPPRNLEQSVFSDGSDVPASGKTINSNNYWARFVYNTVARFKDRIKVWEIWNEPDYNPSSASNWYGFWAGSTDQYYRLLKVAYLAAKSADPGAIVMMGGMAYWPEIQQQKRQPLTFFRRILSLAVADPAGPANRHFFDVTAWHWYNRSSQSFYKMSDVKAALSSYGLGGKATWINETGMPAWNDPARSPSGMSPYFGSGTMTEQASFVMQSMAYAAAAGVERALVFQAYDDGNSEAFGLVRNDGTIRPAYNAFQLASRLLTGTYSATLTEQGRVSVVKAFTNSNNRVVALWNNDPTATLATVTARTGSATLFTQPSEANPAGIQQTIYSSGGQYTISLPGATDSNGDTSTDYIVGGLVMLLVETGVSGPDPASPSPSPIATGIVGNGRFEQGLDLWTQGGSVPVQIGQGRDGSRAAVLGANFVAQTEIAGANSTLSQRITLPANARSLSLSLSYLLDTNQPTPSNHGDPYSYDKFEVLVIDAPGTRYELLADWTANAWTSTSLDMSLFAGQTVTLIFNVWQSAATTIYPTKVFLDDVSLWPFSVPINAKKILHVARTAAASQRLPAFARQ